MNIIRISAFSHNNLGGNPAGIAILDEMPSETKMFSVAKEVGYAETAFLHPFKDSWRIRYFAPELEVPFCVHATIATGAALAQKFDDNTYKLYLNNGEISVSSSQKNGVYSSSLQSPLTSTKPVDKKNLNKVLAAFSWDDTVLHPDYPVLFSSAGANHLILILKSREQLATMSYDFDQLKQAIIDDDLATVSLIYIESDTVIHSRNPFPNSGIYEDPATGAAAAALAGYFRDINWSGKPQFSIYQGQDMGLPSLLNVSFTKEPGSAITIAGKTRNIKDSEWS